MKKKGDALKEIFQKAQSNFAYQMLALEIELDQQHLEHKHRVECISRLLQLYMIAVQSLQSKSDQRYKYFSAKIQQFMKRKVILEEMNNKTVKRFDSQALLEVRKKELGERKQDHDMQMYLSNEQINQKKVKEFVDTAESKLKRFETKIQTNICTQDQDLQDRIKRRKMRSQAGSVQKFKIYKGKVVDLNVNLAGQSEDFFQKALRFKTSGIKQEVPRHVRSYNHM